MSSYSDRITLSTHPAFFKEMLTLTHLLQRNEASKGSFRSIVGPRYKTLELVLIDMHKDKPSYLLLLLLDMLVYGSFQPSNLVIQERFTITTSPIVSRMPCTLFTLHCSLQGHLEVSESGEEWRSRKQVFFITN